MKELIKPNNRETQYSEIEGYCERGDGYYTSYCGHDFSPDTTYVCRGRYSSGDNDSVDILF